MAVSLIVLFYFGNYAMNPAFNLAGGIFHGATTLQVAFWLIAGNVVATILGVFSGPIVNKISRGMGILVAGSSMALGGVVAAFTVDKGLWGIALAGILFFGGMGLCYAPVVDAVVSTVDVSESGRAVGMNDLLMNVSPSIGVAILGSMMPSPVLPEGMSQADYIGDASNSLTLIFLIVAATCAAGVLVFLAVRRKLYPVDGWGLPFEARRFRRTDSARLRVYAEAELPSIGNVAPEIDLPAGEAMNTQSWAISAGSVKYFSDCLPSISALACS